jgi:hypothetical protein
MAPNLVCDNDNDSAYGLDFRRRLRAMGIRDRPTSLRSPWQNPYAERLIGTLRRVCLDHVLIFGERHLLRILSYIRLLQPDAHALGIEQGCAATASRAKIRNHCCHSNSVRIASSLRADMIFGKDRPAQASLADRSAAQRRPLSRGSNPCGCRKPLVSYRINRQLSGWILPPLMIRAFGAH